MKLLRRAYALGAILLCLISQIALHATGLSPRAFKNVNQCFKPGCEYYSPIFGSAALSCGIIENLRFYNVEAAYDANSKRQYIKDKAPANDPIIEIIKILFPSPAGQLTTETAADTSFGKSCTTPEHVAALLNFSYAVRDYYKNQKAAPLPQDNISKILPKISQKDVIAAIFPDDPFKKTEKNKLLLNIVKVIEAERAALKAGNDAVFYPYYFVEQVISAFFCHKFADQKDIRALVNALNENIVDKTKIDQINGLLKKEDIMPALGQVDQGNLDDLWIIANRDIFTRIIPYKNGLTPISNGNVQTYQRSTNTLSDTTFADCIETTVRHIINFMLYDPVSSEFNLSSLDAHMNGKDALYIPNLKAFYNIQPPDKANVGSLILRSAWNKVIADLGHGVKYRQKFDGADAENNNELDTGMLNLVRVFKTIFSLDIAPEPILMAGQEAVFEKSIQKLVTDCLQKLCQVLNPKYSCEIDYEDISIGSSKKDLLGNIKVEVKNQAELLFGFTICVLSNHIGIQNLQISKKDSVGLKDAHIKSIRNKLLNNQEKTIQPSILLLDLELSTNLATTSFVYQLFNEPINDTNSIIKALNNVHDIFKKKAISVDLTILILKNLLHNFLWEDTRSVQQIMVTLRTLQLVPHFKETLENEVKGVAIETETDFSMLFVGLLYLYLGDTCSITQLDFSGCSNLKKIDLWHNKNLESMQLPTKMEHLKEIRMISLGIKTLDLSAYSNLQGIYLIFFENLEAVQLPTKMDSLERIMISDSKIKTLDFPASSNLMKIDLSSNINLESINFAGPMPILKKLYHPEKYFDPLEGDMVAPKFKEISGFKFCPQLKKEDFPEVTITDEPLASEDPLAQFKVSLEVLKSKLAALANSLAGLKIS